MSYPILVMDDETYRSFMPRRLPTSLWIENREVRNYRVSVSGPEFTLAKIEASLSAP